MSCQIAEKALQIAEKALQAMLDPPKLADFVEIDGNNPKRFP